MATQRLLAVDALRGAALWGILVVNIMVFSSPYYGVEVVDPVFSRPVDHVVRLMVSWLFETKFYLLFSFLFGYSFTLQMTSAERGGASFVRRLLRRQGGLFLIGLLHAVLLFHGDILTTYALLGIILLALRKQREGLLVRVAVSLILSVSALWAAFAFLFSLGNVSTDVGMQMHQAAQALWAFQGDWLSVLSQHLQELPDMILLLVAMQAPCALSMFLLGLVAGRRQMLADIEGWRPLQKRLFLLGVGLGLPGAALYAWGTMWGGVWVIAGVAIGLLTAPLLALGYGAGFLLLLQGRWGRCLLALLAPPGRMALSNYLMQSAVCSLVFYGVGLGLMGRVSPGATQVGAFLLYAGQILLSRWWLARFSYGPIEWGLRALTIWAKPKWRS